MSRYLQPLAVATLGWAIVLGPGQALAQQPGHEEHGKYQEGQKDRTVQEAPLTEPAKVLNRVHFISQFEIRCSELVKQRALSENVKDFANDVIKHLTALDKKVVDVARELNIELVPPLQAGAKPEVTPPETTKPGTTLPGKEEDPKEQALETLNRLSNLSGAAFEREYIDAMNMCTGKTIATFEPTKAYFKDMKDDDSKKIRDVVGKVLDNAKDHRDDLGDIQKKEMKK